MSEIEHKSLKDEILYVLGRSTSPLDSGEIYERCTLADEIKRVSDALWILRDSKKIMAVEGEGRKRYVLAKATAGQAGQADTAGAAAAPITGTSAGRSPIRPDHETSLPRIDIPTLGAPAKPQRQKPGPKPKQKPVPGPGPADLISQAGKKVAPSAPVRPEPVEGQSIANAERLADAIIARLKNQFMPIESGLDAIPGPATIHIHIEQVDIHLGGL